MSWDNVLHKRLRDICAYLWEDSRDCRRLVAESLIDSSRINWDEPPTLRWQSVIMECEKQGTLHKLCPILLLEYPENTHLREAVAPWLPNVSGASPDIALVPPVGVPVPEPPVKGKEKAADKVPVKVDPLYADDAAEIFVTMESIRADMAFMSRQLAELRRWRKELAVHAAKDRFGESETAEPMEVSLPTSKPPTNSGGNEKP